MNILNIFKGKEERKLISRIEKQENESKCKVGNVYLKVDSSNYFNQVDDDYLKNVSDKFEVYNTTDKYDLLTKTINYILDKRQIRSEDYFNVSLNLSKLLIKMKKIERETADQVISKYIGGDTLGKTVLNINPKSCTSIGTILSYGYSKLSSYKIKNMKDLMKAAIAIKTKGIDIIQESKNSNINISEFLKTKKKKL